MSFFVIVELFVNVVQDVGSVVFDVDHAYCNRFSPLPPVSAAFNPTFNTAFPVVGFVNVPPFGLIVTVGNTLSILVIVTAFFETFPTASFIHT